MKLKTLFNPLISTIKKSNSNNFDRFFYGPPAGIIQATQATIMLK